MNKTAVKQLAAGLKTIEDSYARELAVQAILPALYDNAAFKFNAVQFCIDANVRALI
jgi:hypothetical protein